MRKLSHLEVTAVFPDRTKNLIGFCIDPETGDEYYLPSHIVEFLDLEQDDYGVTFKGYTAPVTGDDDKPRVIYVKRDSVKYPDDDDDDETSEAPEAPMAEDIVSREEHDAARKAAHLMGVLTVTRCREIIATLQAIENAAMSLQENAETVAAKYRDDPQ